MSLTAEKVRIKSAYDHCRKLARHYENFPVGSILIPKKIRKHFYALYAFMRTADDFADLSSRSKEERLHLIEDWRRQLDEILAGKESENPVFLALGNTIRECNIPSQPLYRLLEAFEFDAKGEVHFETFDQLRWYTSRSAEPVGELVLALFGYRDEDHIRMSNDICTALQILNFIQDIKEDVENDRFYLQLVGRTLVRPNSPDGLKSVLLELDRVETLLESGASLAESVRGRLRYELRAVILSARKMIRKIRKLKGDAYSKRPKLSKFEQGFVLLKALFLTVG